MKNFFDSIIARFAKILWVKAIEVADIEVGRIELKPGDMIILKCKDELSDRAYQHITQSINDLFPNNEHKVVVLEGDMNIVVIGKGGE